MDFTLLKNSILVFFNSFLGSASVMVHCCFTNLLIALIFCKPCCALVRNTKHKSFFSFLFPSYSRPANANNLCTFFFAKNICICVNMAFPSMFLYTAASAWADARWSRPRSGRWLFIAAQWDWTGQRLRQRQRSHPYCANRATKRGQSPLHCQTLPQVHHYQEPKLYPLWHLSHR